MDVVGVVAAVPELVKLVRHVATVAGQISSGTRMAKAVQGSQAQLQALEQILASIQKRNEISSPNSILNIRLAPVLRDVRTETEDLQQLITKVAESDGASKVLKRARLVLKGFEKQFTSHLRRIESATKLLQLYLTELTIQSDQKSRLSKLLHISTTYFIPEKLAGTCEWLWSHETFKAWCRAETSATSSQAGGAQPVTDRVLSIYGVKGSGKSVLASSVVRELRNRGDVALFYSFWAGSSDTRQSITMFRDILWQMLNALPEEVQAYHITRLLESRSELMVPKSVYLELHKLSELHRKSLYIVLDGIDESVDNWNDMKNGPLATLMELSQRNDCLRLLLVGRQSNLRSALSIWPLSIEITKELIGEDLNRLISDEMGNCPNIKDTIVRERVQRELESRSSVMFLWIKLVFKQLRQSFCLSEINDTLSRPPNELNEEYARLFAILVRRLGGHPKNPSVGMDRTKRLLEVIIGASRPLTMVELRLAYAYSCISTDTESTDISSYFVDQEAVIDACGDFVTIQGDLIYFGHISIREFLLRSPEQWEREDESVQFFSLDPNACQRMLGLTCLRYLKNIKWRRDGNTQCFNELTKENPLLHYASSYLISHILSSDPQFEQTSEVLEGFIDSTDIIDYVNYVLSVDDEVTSDMQPLPFQFWDDLLHFLIAWHISGPPERNMFRAALTHISDEDCRDAREICMGLTKMSDASGSISPPIQHRIERWCDSTKDARNILQLDTHDAVEHMASSQSKFGIRQLQLTILNVSTSLKKAEMLLRPVDIILQTLENLFRRMSFLALMTCAALAVSSRPAEEVMKLYEMAAEKVRNKRNLKEVWVLVCMANSLSGRIEILDKKRATNYYGQARDILSEMPQNPLVVTWWCGAARAALDFGGPVQFEQSRGIAREIESQLLSSEYLMRGPNRLRNVGYSTMWRSKIMIKYRMINALQLKDTYEHYDCTEDVERLMKSITQSESYLGSLGLWSQFQCINSLANAMCDLGKSQEARETWNKAVAPLDRGNRLDECLINYTTLNIANSLYNERKFTEAEKELSSLTNISECLEYVCLLGEADTDHINVSIKNIINTYLILRKKDEAISVLQAWVITIQDLMEMGHTRSYQYLRTTISIYLAWQIYDFYDVLTFQTICANLYKCDFNSGVCRRELYVREALAFSLCYQTNPKRYDPYDYYLSFLALHSERYHGQKNGRLSLTRLKIGLARACESTGRYGEAADQLQDVVDDCCDCCASCSCHGCCDCCDNRTTRYSHMCIMHWYRHFFQGRVHLLDKSYANGIVELSSVVSKFSTLGKCDCQISDYEGGVLVVSSHLYLAESFDGRGCTNLAEESRAQALSELQSQFFKPFEHPERSRELELGLSLSTWSAGALDDIVACTGRMGTKWKRFPFEAGWGLWDDCDDFDILHSMI